MMPVDARPKLLLVGCELGRSGPRLAMDAAAASSGFDLEHTADLAAAARFLRSHDVALILVDASISRAEGPSALKRLRQASPAAAVFAVEMERDDLQVPPTTSGPSPPPGGLGARSDQDRAMGMDSTYASDAELLRDTLEALTYPFYVINVSDYTVATANRAALGSSGPVPPGLTCYHMTHRRDTPCGGEQHPCPLRRVTDSREPVTVEHVHYNASGEARHVEVHGYPIFDQDGDLLQMIEYTWDITDRRQAEEALRRERDLVAQLMETSPISITMAGRDGEIIFANARAEEVLGLSRAEITSRTYDAPDWRIADIDGGPFAESELPFRRVMATKKPVYDVRHAVEWPDGRRRILSINGAPLLDPSGDIERVVFAIEDITEQVRAERERIRQIEDELRRLEEVAALPGTAVSARAFGLQPLREALPNVFQSLSDTYASLLDQALDQKAYRHAEPDMDLVRDLAERLGALGATPRDVVDVHVAALRNRSQQANPVKAKAYASEGRLVALRVMGELASYYRRRCVKLTPRTAADRREAGVEEGTAHYE